MQVAVRTSTKLRRKKKVIVRIYACCKGTTVASTTWVIKASKYCNLRCNYCYELEELGDRRRIEPDGLRSIFLAAREIASRLGVAPKFCWHGGEPLLLGHKFFEQAIGLQREVFSGVDPPLNNIQTNLTALGSDNLNLLKKFDGVSISLDVIGAERMTVSGKDSQETVLRNMALLRNAGIPFGAIAVVTAKNINSLPLIFRFYQRANIPLRVLPFYRQASATQYNEHAIAPHELSAAFIDLLDLWFAEGGTTGLAPIEECVLAGVRHLSRTSNYDGYRYDKAQLEHVFVVDTNLDVYGVADTYDSDYCYGNLANDSGEQILESRGRRRAIAESRERVHNTCQKCEYYGACSGWPMAEATRVERATYTENKVACEVFRPLIERSIHWLSKVTPTTV